MVYFNESYLTIHWDELNLCVWMEWKDYAYGEKFRTGLNKGLELLSQKKATRWLADTRNLQVVDQDDQRWINEDWFPRALAFGLRSMAIVNPNSAIAKMSVKDIMQKRADKSLESVYFDDLEEAKKWLRARP